MSSLSEYYNESTYILSLPHTLNKELIDLPLGIKEIIFVQYINKIQKHLYVYVYV